MSTKDKKSPPGIMGLFKKTKTAAQALVEVGSLATKREPPVLLLKDKPETKKQSPRLLKFSASASRLSRASKFPSEQPRASQAQERMWNAMPREHEAGEPRVSNEPQVPQAHFGLD